MVTYEVTATMATGLAEAYATYMKVQHIPDVLATGCFTGAVLERADATTFRARYQAASQERLDAYLREHTARLREDFARHFPEGITFQRAVWTEQKRWTPR